MIMFQDGTVVFNYRVVGIALNGDRVLLHRAEKDDFWALPGGRGELLEPSKDTLKREMQEELGVDVTVERLVWVVENFFEYDDRYFHELAFYFLMTLPEDSDLYAKGGPFAGTEEGSKLIFQWHQIGDLEKTPLYPTFLRRGLRSMPSATEHVVHRDEQT